MLDDRTERNLIGVHPELVHLCYMMDEAGRQFLVPDPPRTKKQQAELYAQGRTKPGDVVTWTLNSKHCIQGDGFAHAFDFVPKPVNYEDEAAFDKMGEEFEELAKRLGIRILWGGRGLGASKKIDRPHIELI